MLLFDAVDELYGDFEDLETGEVHKEGDKEEGEEEEEDIPGIVSLLLGIPEEDSVSCTNVVGHYDL